MSFTEDFEQQIVAISKAGAYDAIKDEYQRLSIENKQLKEENELLKIDLKYEKSMVVALKGLITEMPTEDATKVELARTDPDDIKNVL